MEMAGPLMENAARYAGTRVRVTARARALLIEDDGPGLGTADREQVILRGSAQTSVRAGMGWASRLPTTWQRQQTDGWNLAPPNWAGSRRA